MFILPSKNLYAKILDFLTLIFLLNLFFTMIFMRSFVGIYIKGFQIGKIYIATGLIICFLLFSQYFINKFQILEEKKIINIVRVIVLSFFIVLMSGDISNLSSSTLRNSSFIWSLGYIFIGYILLSRLKLKFLAFIVGICLSASYFITFINYPNFIMDIFNVYSDKFQFIKAADLLLILVIFNSLINNYKKDSNTSYFTFIVSSALVTPYFLIQSRGSVLGASIFILLSFINFRKYIFKNRLKVVSSLLLGILLFYGSSSILTDFDFNKNIENIEIQEVNEAIKEDVVKSKNISQGFLTFYFENGRIYSLDNTTNWRLDIWQDLIDDLVNKNKLIFGFAYEEVYEIMLDPTAPGRLGRDGLNENIHNYFFNILGRGGLTQVILFIYLYYIIFIRWTQKYNKLNFLIYFIPLLVVSSLDVTMEGVQFPLIFFSFIGYFLTLDYDSKE